MNKMLRKLTILLLCLVMITGMLPERAAAADGVAIDGTNFEDEIFRLYVAKEFDQDKNGVLSQEEIGKVQFIYVPDSNIGSLAGIEHFLNLQTLICSNNKLKSLDVSKNTQLTELDCSVNRLTSLDVSQNKALTSLVCGSNQLTALDVSNNTALKTLRCGKNRMTALDLSKNTDLEQLACSGSPIGKLDIRNNPKLMQTVKLGTKEYPFYWDDSGQMQYTAYELNALDYWIAMPSTTQLQTGSSAAPTVTENPKNVTTGSGMPATFSVKAQGSGLKYQWYALDGTTNWEWKAIDGANGATLTITREDQAALFYGKYSTTGCYFCEISNDGGVVCSKYAEIIFVNKPYVVSQPSNKTVKAGKKVTFKVKAEGGSLKYQWYKQKPGTKKWVKISKATNDSYSFKATKKLNGYKYRCRVYNVAGGVYTRAVKLKVK